MLVVALLAALLPVLAVPSGAQSAGEDFDTLAAAGNNDPGGIWSDGEFMWVAGFPSKLYAYSMTTRQRASSQDFDTLDAAGNDSPQGIWSDGVFMWVSDGDDRKLYAYSMVTKNRVPSEDFNTLDAAGNDNPRGIWSNGDIMWVTDGTDDKVYAYSMSTRQRVPSQDFNTNTLHAAGNANPWDIWSDGEFMWVVDLEDRAVYAYRVSDKQRVPCLEIPRVRPDLGLAVRLTGVWSDGGTFWLADAFLDKIHSVRLGCAELGSLSLVNGSLGPGFRPDRLEYLGFVDPFVTREVGLRVGSYPGQSVVFKNNGVVDRNGIVDYDMSAAAQVLTVEVTAQDGVTSRVYRVEMAPKAQFSLLGGGQLGRGSISEDGGRVTVGVVLSKVSARDMTVEVFTGSRFTTLEATQGASLTRLGASLVIPAGRFTGCCVRVTAVDNNSFTGDRRQTVRGRVTGNPGVYSPDPDDLLITVVDDDRPVPGVPENFTVSTSVEGETVFDWDNVDVPRHATRVRYDVFMREPGGSGDDWEFVTHTGVYGAADEGPLTPHSPLEAGTYEFALRAVSIVVSTGLSRSGSALPGEFTAPVTHTVGTRGTRGPDRRGVFIDTGLGLPGSGATGGTDSPKGGPLLRDSGPDPGPLTGFTLVDASDQTVLTALADGGSVALADPDGGSYAIRADTDTDTAVGSVLLELAGPTTVTRTESYAPYSLHGDTYQGAASKLYGRALPPGDYTLTATAYSERSRGGNQLGTLQTSFTITTA